MQKIIEKTELQSMTDKELNAFIETLLPAVENQFLIEQQLPDEFFKADEEGSLYLPLHNANGELTGIKQITGEQAGVVRGTGNDDAGFFQLQGDSPQVTLVANDILIADRVHRETGYTTVVIGLINDLKSIKSQLAPFHEESVIVFCLDDTHDLSLELVPLGITSVNCTDSSNLKHKIDDQIKEAKLRIPECFELRNNGVYLTETGDDGDTVSERICSPLKVSALTRDINSNSWGRYIELLDNDNHIHQLAMPNTDVQGGNLTPLIERGLTIMPKKAWLVKKYLSEAAPTQRARSVSQTGWYKELFVFPEKIIGTDEERIVYQPATESSVNYQSAGTLDEWKDQVATLCKGNSRLTFGVSAAFATMMLHSINGESGGFYFRGESSRGKTTILTLAKSVFGNPRSLPRWRSTVDGLEALAANHNHTLLCLDEFGQLAEYFPKKAGEAIYMLGNGEGKVRAKSNGKAQTVATWQLLYLSAGEISLESVLTKAKMQIRAGQEVRFIDLPSDAGKNLGSFDTIHPYKDGHTFAMAIKNNALKYYGTAAEAFLTSITSAYQENIMKLKRNITNFLSLLDLENADPQVYRVAERFAQVAASGELATELGITGWDEGDAYNAAGECFKAWIDTREGEQSQEERVILDRVNVMLLENKASRFSSKNKKADLTCQAWGSVDEGYFYIFDSVFRNEICNGLNYHTAVAVLKKHGYLLPGKDRTLFQKRYNGETRRVYKISRNIHGLNSVEPAMEDSSEDVKVAA